MEERIGELEDWKVLLTYDLTEMLRNKNRNRRKKKKNQPNKPKPITEHPVIWNWKNFHILIQIPKKERSRDNREEGKLEAIRAKNCQNKWETPNHRFRNLSTYQAPYTLSVHAHTHLDLLYSNCIKLKKKEKKEKMLKEQTRRENHLTYRGMWIRIIADFSSQHTQRRSTVKRNI